jgi:ankyrin repeat protein
MYARFSQILSLIMLPIFSSSLYASDIADAAQQQDTAAVQLLLTSGVDVNEPQNDGATALLWAAQWDDLATAQLLINAGANPALANRTGASPLQLAAINGNSAMLRLLIIAGADPSLPISSSGDTALMMAARTGIPEPIQVLLEQGVDVNATHFPVMSSDHIQETLNLDVTKNPISMFFVDRKFYNFKKINVVSDNIKRNIRPDRLNLLDIFNQNVLLKINQHLWITIFQFCAIVLFDAVFVEELFRLEKHNKD